jgi:glycosyltransferase involved in cell wall biosynthesis
LHNRACELARGDIILQWDDDDWQSPDRIVQQVRALGGPSNDVKDEYPNGAFTFTSQFYWYHLAERRACRARSWEHGGSAGATFAYHRKAWEACPFRDVDQGEDNFFWQDHEARGTPMIDAQDPSLVVYIRHNRNGSHAISDGYTDEDTAACRATLGLDLPFYEELSEILPLDEWNNPHARWRQQHALSYGPQRGYKR